MNPLATIFVLVSGTFLLFLPRKWAPLPLLFGACYMSLGQGFSVGPFSFTVIRMLILIGCIRVFAKDEAHIGALNGLDKILLVWAAWAILSSAGHNPNTNPLVFRLGLVYNTMGIYFLIRCLCRDLDDVVSFLQIIAVLMVPLALEMINEHITHRNLFAVFEGVPEIPEVRKGRLRAQGPFAHSILAGSVGAMCMPLMIGIWRRNKLVAKVGFASCIVIVVSSSSSGPLMSAVFGCGAVFLWRYRQFMKEMRIGVIALYLLLEIVMKAPAYFLIARIDLTGGSTGWHRARLIQSAFEHLDEWWLFGTDFTRHWMGTGVSWSADHSDITNHYLKYGVLGGLPLMIMFVAALLLSFRYVGASLKRLEGGGFSGSYVFIVWTTGAALFAHAASMISVSYFDQSFIFLYANLAIIGSLPGCVDRFRSNGGIRSSFLVEGTGIESVKV